jgi:ketosteroid isomerase-like protein
MSEANVEIVRVCVECLNSRNFSQLFELFDAGIELDLSRNVFNPDVYRGYSGVERWRSAAEDVWNDLHGVLTELIDAGDKVVVAVTMRGKGKESGVEVEMRLFSVWTIRASKVVRVVGGYRDRSEAFAAAGLPGAGGG